MVAERMHPPVSSALVNTSDDLEGKVSVKKNKLASTHVSRQKHPCLGF